jgi:hypothetical protein
MKGFLFTLIPVAVILVAVFLAKLGKLNSSSKIASGGAKAKIDLGKLRTTPGGIGSAAGQVITIFVLVFVLSAIFMPELLKVLVSGPWLWGLVVALLCFYVFFPMGDKLPKWLFQIINVLFIVGFLALTIKSSVGVFQKDRGRNDGVKNSESGQLMTTTNLVSGNVFHKYQKSVGPFWTTVDSLDLRPGLLINFYLEKPAPPSTISYGYSVGGKNYIESVLTSMGGDTVWCIQIPDQLKPNSKLVLWFEQTNNLCYEATN